ncbi:hypothetical protein OG552_32250 [Streptomyces sp. NBC_01476]|uniref:hypothetical protein n=1 Tax=Streptomyces sp. NBC_01476 TaxID=2903881 RepID=UPI002E34FE71|nr:hypothetical protein [Streptomyces sp. NBC_01476]
MSDNVLSVIPTDPWWQPGREAAGRARDLVVTFVDPDAPSGVDVDTDVTWHDTVAVVDCGSNLERIGCPQCGAEIDTEWWRDLLDYRCEDGFSSLAAQVPCCGAETSLDALEYDWPCGFARFEIAVWNPGRLWFTSDELTALADALGHPVRQVMAHI